MDETLVLPVVMRWLHVLSAIAVAGSIFFYVLVLRPAVAKTLAPEYAAALRDPLMRRWKLLIHPSILLFLLSGFYNYLVVVAPAREGQSLYHALFGMKFLLSLAVFTLAIVLTSTRDWSQRWRDSRGAWIALALCTVAVVMLGGVMKILPPLD